MALIYKYEKGKNKNKSENQNSEVKTNTNFKGYEAKTIPEGFKLLDDQLVEKDRKIIVSNNKPISVKKSLTNPLNKNFTPSLSKEQQIMNEYNNPKEINYSRLLDLVMKDEGGTPEQYRKLEDMIAFHESAHTMSPEMKQFDNGPGRGLFQYEGPSGATAVNRTLTYLQEKNVPAPEWLKQLKGKEKVDFSKLSEEQQRFLFLGDKKNGPGDLSQVMSNKQSIQEFWGKYHQTKNDPEKIKKFTEDMKLFETLNNEKLKGNVQVKVPVMKKGGILYKV